MSLLYIIIVNWNNWQDTVECLQSIAENSYPDYHLVLVDNGSKNDSRARIKEAIKGKNQITLLSSAENIGFAGANNLGIRFALEKGAEYILLLNNDTLVEKEFLKELIKTARERKEVGIVGGKIYQHGEKGKIWYQGGRISWLWGGGIHPGKGKREKKSKKEGEIEVSFITGCLMLIKKSTFEKIGLLEERYFLYVEDADFCVRALRENIELRVNLAAVIVHKEDSKLEGWKPYHIYYLIRNRLIFMKRYAPNYFVLGSFYCMIFSGGFLLILKWALLKRFDLIAGALNGGKDFMRGITGPNKRYSLS